MTKLYCFHCASIMERQEAEYQPHVFDHEMGKLGCWFPFEGWKMLQCPSCNFFVQNNYRERRTRGCRLPAAREMSVWQELEAIALARGATEVLPEWAEDWENWEEDELGEF